MKYIWEARDIRNRPVEKEHGKGDTSFRYKLDVVSISTPATDISLFDENGALAYHSASFEDMAKYLSDNEFIPSIEYL